MQLPVGGIDPLSEDPDPDLGGKQFRFEFQFSPFDDIGSKIADKCEEAALSPEACQSVMEAVAPKYEAYTNSARGKLASMDYPEAFSRLLGFVEGHPSFPAAAEAAISSDAFTDVGAWWRYHELVGEALGGAADLDRFSHEPLYHFTAPYWTWGDPEAAALAEATSAEDKARLFAAGDSHVGYAPGELPNHANGVLPTTNTCRHTMQLCLLLRALRTSGLPMADAAVVEIGGGYGNMARLVASAYGFRHWTVFDMAFMNRLQRFYFNATLGAAVATNLDARAFQDLHADPARGAAGGSDAWAGGRAAECAASAAARFNLVDTRHLNAWAARGWAGCDVLVATSSLSELAMEDFFWYYNHLLPRARFLLYAYSRRWPSPEMAAEKMQLISRLFEPLQAVESNHNLTVSLVMRNRNRDL